ncbi:hypothetical protein J2Z19_004671 [Ensifer adhaerens]|uniref:Uncharacterized protein n=1 Tax=Ensifer adhaerens TaxID=106592 RepID=A0ACC5T1I8_ENSAD|nr:hypothetical protein [Ensifer adhaerens]
MFRAGWKCPARFEDGSLRMRGREIPAWGERQRLRASPVSEVAVPVLVDGAISRIRSMRPGIQRLMSASQNREKAATSRAFDDPVAGQAGATKKKNETRTNLARRGCHSTGAGLRILQDGRFVIEAAFFIFGRHEPVDRAPAGCSPRLSIQICVCVRLSLSLSLSLELADAPDAPDVLLGFLGGRALFASCRCWKDRRTRLRDVDNVARRRLSWRRFCEVTQAFSNAKTLLLG